MRNLRRAFTSAIVAAALPLATMCSCQQGAVTQNIVTDTGPEVPHPAEAPLANPKDGGSISTCTGSADGVCSATERLFLERDPGCYTCLWNQGCIDDTNNDKGNECGDLAGMTDAGASRTQLCLDVIRCTLGHASAQPILNAGYCGTAAGMSCTQPGRANGPCLEAEQAGSESTDPTTVLKRYTSKAYGAGMANQIFQCAIFNQCRTCLR